MDKKALHRVLFTIGNLSGGGAERVISLLANAFADRGMDVCICCIGRDQKNVAYPLDDRIRLLSIPSEKGGKLGQLLRLRQAVKAFVPDVVISFMSYIAIQTLASLLFTGIPVVYSIRSYVLPDAHVEMGKESSVWRIIHWGTLLLYPRARGAVYQSKEQQACFRPARRRKETVIPNPIDPDPLWDRPNRNEEKKIIAVGRLAKEKNYPLLLHAFARILPDFPDYRLEILGEGPERKAIELLIQDLALENTVSMPGFVSNVREKVFSASIYALSSEYEGMPNALMEAMCLGTPCITTDFLGGVAHTLIEDGVNGRIVPRGDVDALAQAMAELLSHEQTRKELGKNGKALRKQVTTETIVSEWLSFLHSIIA